MLKSLYIKNYALIDTLNIEFEPGFSVITGETGAGKSIILGALSLILGQRAETKYIKKDADKCIVEGTFDTSKYDLLSFCEENNIDYDPKTFILRREILSNGKSRAFINDTPVTINDLKLLGEQLIDIHSQHENLLLASQDFQLRVVDIIANNKTDLIKYQDTFALLKKQEKELRELEELISKNKEEEEFLRFQYKTLDEAKLTSDEQDELESELQLLTHAEDIKANLFKIYSYLSGEENNNIVSSLKTCLSTSHSLEKVYPRATEFGKRIESAYIDLNDLSSDIERLANDVDFNPERLSFVQERLNLIYNLETRYKVSNIRELIDLQEELKIKLDKLDLSDDEIKTLRNKVEETKNKAFKHAETLTKSRKKASTLIEKQLIEKIATLGMPNAKLECKISPRKVLDKDGGDFVEFLFSANKNIPLQPVSQVASGGEISRFMLCLKSIIAGATALPSIIFDEIDTGVSGEISDKMGVIMQEFGQTMQVIAITHQPQIASRGKIHYKVYKRDEANTTSTHLIQLSEEQRIEEIAGMLSGSTITNVARENARFMLNSNKI